MYSNLYKDEYDQSFSFHILPPTRHFSLKPAQLSLAQWCSSSDPWYYWSRCTTHRKGRCSKPIAHASYCNRIFTRALIVALSAWVLWGKAVLLGLCCRLTLGCETASLTVNYLATRGQTEVEPCGFCLAWIPRKANLPLFRLEGVDIFRVQGINEWRRAARIALTWDCFDL